MWKPRTVQHVHYCAASGRAGGRPTLTRFPTDFYLPLEDMRDGGRQHVRRWRYSRPGRAALILAAAACEAQSFLLAPQATPRTHQASNAARQTLRSATPPAASAVKSEATESSAGGSISIGTETLDPIFGGEKAATEVVVVGAGVGGLATAARLAKAGCRVTVVEKNGEEDVGGRLNEMVLDGGFRFDTGPSLLLLPDTYRETFADLGRDSDEFFEMRRVSPTYKVYFDDGDSVDLSDDEEQVRRHLDRLEDGGFDKYQAYLGVAQLNLEVGLPNFIEEKLTPGRLPEFALGALFNSPLENHYKQLSRRFESEKMRALLSFQDLYVGLSPYNAPAVFSLLQAIELGDGVYYPMGGFARVAEALGTVCKDLGVKFRFDCPVSEVSVVGDRGRVNSKGVVLESGDVLEADVVVCNADLPYAEQALLPEDVSRSFEKSEYSSSVVAFYFCSNKRWPQLSHHTVFLSTDWKGSWDSAFGKLPDGELSDRFNFYAAAPARTDPSVCPEGSDAIMVLVPCPSIPDDYSHGGDDNSSGDPKAEGDARRGVKVVPDRKEWVRRAREGVIRDMEASAGMEGFGDSIVGEEVYAPWDWRDRYNLRRGAVFGLSHGLNQLSLLRPGPQHPTVNGLWFCGASSRPGNGVPLVLIGAKKVAENVLKVVAGGNT